MVSYELAPEQQDLRDSVAQFAHDVVAPVIGDYYERGEFPYDIVAKMGKLGLFGLPFPEEYGGMGGDYFALCLALEELARVDSSVAITLEAGVSLGAMPIYRFGTDEQKRRWLPELCTGERLGAFGLTEPGGGSDVRRHAHHGPARRRNGEWVINGTKAFITNSGTAITALVTVMAVTGRGEDGRKEISSIIVPSGTPGFIRRSGVLQGRLVRLGHPRALLHRLPGARRRTCSASGAAATRSSCGSSTRAGSRSRRWPPGWRRAASTSPCATPGSARRSAAAIGQHQAIQFTSPTWRCGRTPPGWPTTTRRPGCWPAEPFKKEAAIAKLIASNAAMDNARDATQVFGGYGFMNEFPVGRFYRDAKVLEIGEGTSEVQRMLIASPASVTRSPFILFRYLTVDFFFFFFFFFFGAHVGQRRGQRGDEGEVDASPQSATAGRARRCPAAG